MEESFTESIGKDKIEFYHSWWSTLSNPWKTAFNEVFLQRSEQTMPSDELLHQIFNSSVLRFAGPKAMHPNLTFELTDLSGISLFPNVSILIAINMGLQSLNDIKEYKLLTSLFVFNNALEDISIIAHFKDLNELYFQHNRVKSLSPLSHLTKLHTISCNDNLIETLEGLGIQHEENLKQFVCKPNELLRNRTIMAFESETGIKCK